MLQELLTPPVVTSGAIILACLIAIATQIVKNQRFERTQRKRREMARFEDRR
jgi:hypothetical protein